MKNIKCIDCGNLNRGWCHKVTDSPDPMLKRDCPYYIYRTNYLHLLTLDVDEMARFLIDCIGFDCNACSEHHRLSDNPLLKNEKCDEFCEVHLKEWLNEGVKHGRVYR